MRPTSYARVEDGYKYGATGEIIRNENGNGRSEENSVQFSFALSLVCCVQWNKKCWRCFAPQGPIRRLLRLCHWGRPFNSSPPQNSGRRRLPLTFKCSSCWIVCCSWCVCSVFLRLRTLSRPPTYLSLLEGVDLEMCLLPLFSVARQRHNVIQCSSSRGCCSCNSSSRFTRAVTPASPAASTRDRDARLAPGFRTLCLSEAGSTGSAFVSFAERTALPCVFGERNGFPTRKPARPLAAKVFSALSAGEGVNLVRNTRYCP